MWHSTQHITIIFLLVFKIIRQNHKEKYYQLFLNSSHLQGGDEAAGGEVPDLAAIKARVREMEEEAEKLKQMQTEVDKQMSMGSPPGLSKFCFANVIYC